MSIQEGIPAVVTWTDHLYQSCSCRAFVNGVQVINTGVWTKVLFDAKDYDIGNDFDADGVDSNFIVPDNGYYYIFAQGMFNGLADGKFLEMHVLDNALVVVESCPPPCGALGGASDVIASTFRLIAGHAISIEIYHNHGADRTIEAGSERTFICIHKIGE